MFKFDMQEFEEIIYPFKNHPKVLEMKNYSHHGTTRYDHSMRVAYLTYWVTKHFHLNYYSATKAAFLHDFYFDEVEKFNKIKQYTLHPFYASKNADEYFGINQMERDIIEKHMFPFRIMSFPKYRESWVVDFADDFSAIYEKYKTTRWRLEPAINVFLIVIFTMIH